MHSALKRHYSIGRRRLLTKLLCTRDRLPSATLSEETLERFLFDFRMFEAGALPLFFITATYFATPASHLKSMTSPAIAATAPAKIIDFPHRFISRRNASDIFDGRHWYSTTRLISRLALL